MINEEQKLMNEVMDDSYYLNGKGGMYYTAYFWKKDPKYSAISDYDLDTFQSKCRKQVKKYLTERRNQND